MGTAQKAGLVVQRLLDAVCFILLAGGTVAVVVIGVGLVRGGHPRLDLPVALSVRGGSVIDGRTGSGSASVVHANGQLSIKAPVGVVIAGLVFAAAGMGLVLVVLRQLRALLAETLAGSPFGPRSARRVRLIGGAIIAAAVIRAAIVLASSLWARSHVHSSQVAFRAAFPLQIEMLGIGAVVMVLSEVFRIGAALQRDHDLTI